MRLAIGTAQFGSEYGITNKYGKVDNNKAKEILDLASLFHVNTIDTAYDYNGVQELIGSLDVKNFKIVTKLPRIINDNNISKNINIKFKETLNRLKVDKLYGLLIHDTKQLYSENGYIFWNELQAIKKKGYVQNIGYSIYGIQELEDLYYKFKPDIIQIPCNIFDQRLIKNGWVQKLYDENVLIFVRSVFLQGLLLLEVENLPKEFSKWNPLWIKWNGWLKENNISALEACLNFFLNDKRIDKIIVGVENSFQLNEILNIKKTDIKFPKWMANNDPILLNPSLWNNLK